MTNGPDLKRTSVFFVRIAPRAHILDENNRVKDSAILGTKPFVFFTTPESIDGKFSIFEHFRGTGRTHIAAGRRHDQVP